MVISDLLDRGRGWISSSGPPGNPNSAPRRGTRPGRWSQWCAEMKCWPPSTPGPRHWPRRPAHPG